jgi:cytochrome c biogenesis protein ResB
LEPGLRCALTVGDQTREFSLRLSRRALQVRVGQEVFFVRYRMDDRAVDFALTLKHAQQLSDPGTSRAASYQSDVVLSYEKDGQTVCEDRTISMNHTLDHGQYKVYQANYRPLTDPDTLRLVLDPHGKLVSLSGLSVAHDPGLYWKYTGSCLLVLGIAIMFYMKAYFFKPRAARPLAA